VILALPTIICRDQRPVDDGIQEGSAGCDELHGCLDDKYPPAGTSRRLLDLFALLDPRGVPADLLSTDPVVGLLSEPLTHTITAAETRGLLLGFHQRGLLSVSLGGGDRVVRLSGARQRLARRLLSAERRARLGAVLAEALVERWPSLVADLDLDLLRLLRCAAALAGNTGDDLLRGGPPGHLLLRLAGQALAQLGLPLAALDYTSGLAGRTADALGVDHPEALRARADVASWRGQAGDRHGATAAYGALVADYQRVLGAEHPETLDLLSNYASQRARGDEASPAVTELENVLAAQSRTLGENDVRTLTTRAKIITWRAKARLATPATTIDAFDEVLYHFWENHPSQFTETFRTRASLATALVQNRRQADGADVLRDILSDQLRLFRTDNPATIDTRRRLLRACEAAKDDQATQRAWDELATHERRVLIRYEYLFGADQPDVRMMRAAALPREGGMARSGEVARQRQLLTELTQLKGVDAPETLRAWSSLAVAIGNTGDPEKAVAELTALRDIAERTLGASDPEVLAILARLATWQGNAKHRKLAVQTLKTLAARRAEGHPHRLVDLYALASQHRRSGYAIGYGDALCQLLTLRERYDLPEDALIWKARMELAVWRARHGATATVVRDLRQILKARKDLLGPNSPGILANEFELAHWLWETGHPEEAQALLTKLQRLHDKRNPKRSETIKTLKRWQTTSPPPVPPPIPPTAGPVNGPAADLLDTILGGLAGHEAAAAALIEVLALTDGRELSAEAWQAAATTYCATAIVEQADLGALVGAAGSVITSSTDGAGGAVYLIANSETAQVVLHRAAQRTGLPIPTDTALRQKQVKRLVSGWEHAHLSANPASLTADTGRASGPAQARRAARDGTAPAW